jgi:hypothetical protein
MTMAHRPLLSLTVLVEGNWWADARGLLHQLLRASMITLDSSKSFMLVETDGEELEPVQSVCLAEGWKLRLHSQ